MMISICNSNIREFGTQRPLQGAVASGDWGLGHLGGHEKSLRGGEGFFRGPSRA